MRYLMDKIDIFRYEIWSRINIKHVENEKVSESNVNHKNSQSRLYIPFGSFRIFGFIDDTHRLGYNEDVQRAFYSGYFSGHGLKVQAVTLPNDLFDSGFCGSLSS